MDSSSTVAAARRGRRASLTKRGAWPDARGRIFLRSRRPRRHRRGRVRRDARRRVTCSGLARAENADGTQCYRARKTHLRITIEEANDAPCQLRDRGRGRLAVAGLLLARRRRARVNGGQARPVLALPLMGQVMELYGGEVTNAGNYFAGAAASMQNRRPRALTRQTWIKCEAGRPRPTTRALETVHRELGVETRSSRIVTRPRYGEGSQTEQAAIS